ncbi:Carbamoyl-phosphate synthase L chain, N-terminal domain [Geodermatophilus dictyosporus]|uniref:biotin carboxylase n=1 Tax=Geodermatophilus dictyosporus TaxID=1523247 RepID=A0A1I5L203_9ACTN|nr:biotin carboxylase N-terminal domain-containing protein [Geodermatophilus dictyosporus]SFO91203.1 Carbamoyl-phosphate synthase L chain, N-terminal domain [Geodermatophilus dictyosporus]
MAGDGDDGDPARDEGIGVAQHGIESVLVAGRGPAACAVIAACSRLDVKSVAVYSEAERSARHVRLADDAVLLGAAPAVESYLAVDRIVEAARRSGVAAVLPVPPALAGNAALAGEVAAAGLTWIGPPAEVLERLGGDGVEPASEHGLLALVTDEGLRYPTPVARDRAAGTARVSWTPEPPLEVPPGAKRLAEVGWRGLVTVGVSEDGELGEIAAGFSLDMAVLERAHRVDAVDLALAAAAGERGPRRRTPEEHPPRAAVAVQLRATLPPGRAGRVTGWLPDSGRVRGTAGRTEVVAVSGYEPGDRLDAWYDALLATVSAGGDDTATAARAAAAALSGLPETGVPHDGDEVRAVLGRLADGDPAPGS